MESDVWYNRDVWHPLLTNYLFSTGQITPEIRAALESNLYTGADMEKWLKSGAVRKGDDKLAMNVILHSVKPGLLNRWGIEYTDSMKKTDLDVYNSRLSKIAGTGGYSPVRQGEPGDMSGGEPATSAGGLTEPAGTTRITGISTLTGTGPISATTATPTVRAIGSTMLYSVSPDIGMTGMLSGSPRPILEPMHVMPTVRR
jgi:hypothetical protein